MNTAAAQKNTSVDDPADLISAPLRQDAARNRKRIMASAAEVFAEQGLEASVEQIAVRAGVGMGTLYRRFPTKQALVDELVIDLLTNMRDLARSALLLDDGSGLEVFLIKATEAQHFHRGCLPQVWGSTAGLEIKDEVIEIVGKLVDNARDYGAIRADVTHGDIRILIFALRGIVESTGDIAPEAWKRHLELAMIGLRPGGPQLSNGPVTPTQFKALPAKTVSRAIS